VHARPSMCSPEVRERAVQMLSSTSVTLGLARKAAANGDGVTATGSNLHFWCFSLSAMRFAIMLRVE